MSTCEGCGVEFQRNYPKQRFHNQACFMQKYNRDNADGHSNRGAKKGGAIRGKQLQEAEQTGQYLKEDGRHVHRVVAERALGRSLLPLEVVHHEDLDKRNNDPVNLIVFPSQAWHARHHKLGHPGKGPCSCQGIRLGEVMPK